MMSEEIYGVEDVRDEFLENVLGEYSKVYSKQQVDLAVYLLNDFVSNLVGNDLVLLKVNKSQSAMSPPPYYVEAEQMVRPQPQVYGGVGPGFEEQRVQPRRVESVPRRFEEQRVQPRRVEGVPREGVVIDNSVNPFGDDGYVDPRSQRVRVDPRVARDVAELNAQLRSSQASQDDVVLGDERKSSFVDRIRDMRSPKKRDTINPEE